MNGEQFGRYRTVYLSVRYIFAFGLCNCTGNALCTARTAKVKYAQSGILTRCAHTDTDNRKTTSQNLPSCPVCYVNKPSTAVPLPLISAPRMKRILLLFTSADFLISPLYTVLSLLDLLAISLSRFLSIWNQALFHIRHGMG